MGQEPSPRSSRVVFAGRLLNVAVEAWPSEDREVVHHPGACAVVAVTPSGDLVLVRQFRPAVRTSLLEIPAGIMDVPGESPSECASRELLEETGFRVETIEPLGSVFTSPGFSDERIELFVARTGDEPVQHAEDGIEVVRMTFSAAVAAVEDGRIEDAKTIAALMLARDMAS